MDELGSNDIYDDYGNTITTSVALVLIDNYIDMIMSVLNNEGKELNINYVTSPVVNFSNSDGEVICRQQTLLMFGKPADIEALEDIIYSRENLADAIEEAFLDFLDDEEEG